MMSPILYGSLGLLRSLGTYLEGQGDLASRLINNVDNKSCCVGYGGINLPAKPP